jgi:hypothetical protein
VQGGGQPGLNLLGGAVALVGIDARPLILAFAISGGAAAYFRLPYEPPLAPVLGAAAGSFLIWLAGRLWWTSDTAITLALILFGACLGLAAASLRAQSVDAPVIRSETGPALVEG